MSAEGEPRKLLWWELAAIAIMICVLLLMFAVPGIWITKSQDGTIENAIARAKAAN